MAQRWQDTPDGYSLNHAELTAELVLTRHTPGLRNMSLGSGATGLRWAGPILGVQSLQASGKHLGRVGAEGALLERRLRRNVVDAQFRATKRWPARLHLYWKATTAGQIDLEVLVATPQPLEKLEVVTVGHVPCAEAMVPVSGKRTSWVGIHAATQFGSRSLVLPRDRAVALFSMDGRTPRFGETVLAPAYGYPIVVYRLRNPDWSYVEMSHPEDCARIVARVDAAVARVSFGLFGLDLEKGVILRGRVRGIFVPRRADLDQAMELFKRFLAQKPPLSV